MIPLFHSATWHNLTTSGTAMYHPLWAPALVFEATVTGIMAVVFIVLLVFLFQKRRLLPALMIGVAFFILAARTVDSIAVMVLAMGPLHGGGYVDLAHDMMTTALTGFVIALVLAAIWIPYLLLAKWVRNTFTRGRSVEAPPRLLGRISRQTLAYVLGLGLAASVVVLVLLSWGTASVSGEIKGLTTQTGDIKTYTDPDYGYSFDYPADWVLQRSIYDQNGSTLVSKPGTAWVYGPYGSPDTGGYGLDSMGVVVTPLGVGVAAPDLPQIKQTIETYLSQTLKSQPSLTVVEPLAETTVGGLKGYAVTMSETYGDIDLTVTSYYLFGEDLEYDMIVQTKTANMWALEDDIAAFLASFKPGPEK
jgi:Protein of unknown function (DUF2569)